jgi:transposase-like protein
MTMAQAAEALDRERAGETKTALAKEYGLSRRALSDWLRKAADEEARADAPVDSGVMRTPREVLQSILNDLHAKPEHKIQASRAMDALSEKTLDGDDVARPASITLSGPVACPGCGLDLRDVREVEIDLIIAGLSAEPDITPPGEPDTATASVNQDNTAKGSDVPIPGQPPVPIMPIEPITEATLLAAEPLPVPGVDPPW